MDDINFDELDKAVNSVLKQTTKKEELKPEPKPELEASDIPAVPQVSPEDIEKESPTSHPRQNAEASASAPSEPATAPVAKHMEPATRPAAVIVPKRRGQFMDLVHPSSDMTNTSQTAHETPLKSNRQSGMLQPLDPSIVEVAPAEKPVAPEKLDSHVPEVKSEDAQATEVSIETSSPAHECPDPLDMDGHDKPTADSTEPEEQSSETPAADVSQVESGFTTPEDKSDSDAQPAATEPVESPFIKGAEVEKRPLGTFTEGTEDEVPAEAAESSEPAAPAAEPLPQELTPAVVSVESDDPAHALGSTDGNDSAVSVGAAASIAPQYHAKAAEDDEDSHPVFDTKDYHQPLAPPAKKGHGKATLWIFLVLLVLIGAGAWYAIAVLKLI